VTRGRGTHRGDDTKIQGRHMGEVACIEEDRQSSLEQYFRVGGRLFRRATPDRLTKVGPYPRQVGAVAVTELPRNEHGDAATKAIPAKPECD
jgi:hypothetical protein